MKIKDVLKKENLEKNYSLYKGIISWEIASNSFKGTNKNIENFLEEYYSEEN